MTKSHDELIHHLEMIARISALLVEVERGDLGDARNTWAWKARNRLMELEAEIIATKEQTPHWQMTAELIRESVTGVMLETDWRHKKTGNVYQVIGGCRIEATNKLGILYAREGVVWCRPSEEFLDGRFEAL